MTVPNILSIFRILLVPVFVILVMSDMPNAYIYGMIVFVLAGATDVLDGKIARKYNCISVLGKLLDPLADKLMVGAALVCAGLLGLLPMFLPILYVVKEVLQCLGGVFLYKHIKDMIPSNVLGKAATVFFFLMILAVYLIPGIPYTVKLVMALICTVFIAVTVIMYATIAVRWLKARPKEK